MTTPSKAYKLLAHGIAAVKIPVNSKLLAKNFDKDTLSVSNDAVVVPIKKPKALTEYTDEIPANEFTLTCF